MRIKEQFEKSANSYEDYSKVQLFGAKTLIKELQPSLNTIIDLGCGSGRVYKELIKSGISFNKFIGVDFAKSMLNLHPKGKNVELIRADFNDSKLFKSLRADVIVSASALQWAKDLNQTFKDCANSAKMGYFYIFSANTFKSLHKTIDIKSPIYTKEEILSSFNSSYNLLKYKEFNYNLKFNTPLEMLKYIKRSGVSGGLNIGYKKTKYLLEHYPLDYLEFETLLLVGESRCLK